MATQFRFIIQIEQRVFICALIPQRRRCIATAANKLLRLPCYSVTHKGEEYALSEFLQLAEVVTRSRERFLICSWRLTHDVYRIRAVGVAHQLPIRGLRRQKTTLSLQWVVLGGVIPDLEGILPINRRKVMKVWSKPQVREQEVGLEVTSYLPAEIDII